MNCFTLEHIFAMPLFNIKAICNMDFLEEACSLLHHRINRLQVTDYFSKNGMLDEIDMKHYNHPAFCKYYIMSDKKLRIVAFEKKVLINNTSNRMDIIRSLTPFDEASPSGECDYTELCGFVGKKKLPWNKTTYKQIPIKAHKIKCWVDKVRPDCCVAQFFGYNPGKDYFIAGFGKDKDAPLRFRCFQIENCNVSNFWDVTICTSYGNKDRLTTLDFAKYENYVDLSL